MKIKATDIVTFAVIFVLVIGLGGMAGYKSDKDSKLPTNSFLFDSLNGREYLVAEDGGTFIVYLPLDTGQYYTMGFRLDPRELRNLELDLSTLNATYNAKTIYTSVNPDDPGAKVGVAKLGLVRSISLVNPTKITESFVKDSDPINPDIPIKNCDDSTPENLVIEFRIGSQDKVYLAEDCVVIEGKDADSLIEVSDRLGYALLGVY